MANKFFTISKVSKLSKTLQGRIKKFGTYNPELGRYEIVAPLIAQLGKNYSSAYDKLLTGDELLKMACDKVRKAQAILGGKLVYLECEDKPFLKEFYS